MAIQNSNCSKLIINDCIEADLATPLQFVVVAGNRDRTASRQFGELADELAKLGLEGIISKRLDAPYRSGPSKGWIKVKNPTAPAAMRIS